MDKLYEKTKDKIDEGLEKLNTQPLTAENACQYKELTEALYYLITASSMLDYSEENGYSGTCGFLNREKFQARKAYA